MLLRIMYTKRIILLIVGIFVAIAICVSTSVFGMRIAKNLPFIHPDTALKSDSDFILVFDRHVDRNAVVAKF